MAQAKPAKSKGGADQLAAPFLADAHAAVKTVMTATQTLPEFRLSESALDRDDKLRLVQQAIILMRDNYVHLPLKENMHAVRPMKALNLLLQKLESSGDEMSDLDFHAKMIGIFTSVRDLHTNYFLPAPYNKKTAFVPMLLESYFDNGTRRYLVAHLLAGFSQPPFEAGVEVISWNGAPIELAVAANANRFAGSNAEARRARGIERMTIRPLVQSLPPDENFVLIGYRTQNGEDHEIRLDWLVFSPDRADGMMESMGWFGAGSHAIGIDIDAQMTSIAKKFLFAPNVVAAEASVKGGKASRRRKKFDVGETIPSDLPQVFNAKTVSTAQGDFGHIRIFTFSVDDADDFVAEFIRLVEKLPQRGLILDVRGNGGGLVFAGECLLQTLTPKRIETQRSQFINSALNLDIVRANSPSIQYPELDLSQWKASMEESVTTGAVYSRGFPITDMDWANSIGQRYQGPIVLITDAKCYSTTDIFAAGFQDHDIGLIIGVDGNTGAGGANVWTHSLLKFIAGQDGPYDSLPNGANMRVAIRRTLRVGERAGTPVEDLGVQPDIQYQVTKNDLLNSNADLIEFAGAKLAEQQPHVLQAVVSARRGDDMTVSITTKNVDRVDVYLDDRPMGAHDVEDGKTELTIEDNGLFGTVFFHGFNTSKLVAACRIAC